MSGESKTFWDKFGEIVKALAAIAALIGVLLAVSSYLKPLKTIPPAETKVEISLPPTETSEEKSFMAQRKYEAYRDAKEDYEKMVPEKEECGRVDDEETYLIVNNGLGTQRWKEVERKSEVCSRKFPWGMEETLNLAEDRMDRLRDEWEKSLE